MHASLLANNLDRVRARVAAAAERSGRPPADVTLVAVTKYVEPAVARELADLGQLDLGENRVQELHRKAVSLPPAIRWHLIGPLQANKARKAVTHAPILHAVEDLDLLARLDRIALELSKPVRALLEINISGEGTKHGLSPDTALAFLRDAKRFSQIEMIGLMTMARAEAAEPELRSHFRALRLLRDRARVEGLFAASARQGGELSMGMSSDFEIAIEEGATLVRVGSALFEGLPLREEPRA
ncbi:MAG: YggS family pyridoxal phosphate-dependent enzyme [Planctomycetes bacterium]|nr:YggS family pyridoxal phosphate-dependent enzyme [Planctomycetota bacterium]